MANSNDQIQYSLAPIIYCIYYRPASNGWHLTRLIITIIIIAITIIISIDVIVARQSLMIMTDVP